MFNVSFSLQQAITYAEMMDVLFVYSSNGDAFYEHDMLTGKERDISLWEFLSPDELIERYKANANGGKGLSENDIAVISKPYYFGQNTYEPRYYQRVAINRTVDAIARGEQTSSCYGNRYVQDVYCISDCLPPAEKRNERFSCTVQNHQHYNEYFRRLETAEGTA